MPRISDVIEAVDILDPSYTGDCPDSHFIFHSPMNCNMCEAMLKIQREVGEILLLNVVED